MKRIQIAHKTACSDRTFAILGARRAPVRPREFRDVHLERSLLEIEAQADARWIRDPFTRMEVIVEVVLV
jgi:hypothetical protein